MIPPLRSRKSRRVRTTAALLSLSAGIAGAAIAQTGSPVIPPRAPFDTPRASSAAVAPTPSPAPAHALRQVTYRGDTSTSRNTPNGQIDRLEKNVKIQSEDTTLVSDLVTYNEKSSIASSPGRLQIDDAQNTIKGDSGLAYYKAREAHIIGNVNIVVRPKPDDAKAPEGSPRRDFKDPINITCDNADYNWHTRVAVLTGHLVMISKHGTTVTRTVTADKATYDGKTETVVLEGHVHYKNSNGDVGDTPTFTAVLTEGHEVYTTGEINGAQFVTDDDDSETGVGKSAGDKAGSKPATPGSPAGAPPPPAAGNPAAPAAPAPSSPAGSTTPSTPAAPAPSGTGGATGGKTTAPAGG